MPSMYLSTPGLRVNLDGGRLVLLQPESNVRGASVSQNTVLLRDVDRVVVSESVILSFPVMTELLRREIPVVILSRRDEVLGLCHPPSHRSTVRMMQYRCAADPAFCLALAIAVVEAKVLNQRRVLQRLAANRPEAEVTPVLLRLANAADAIPQARSVDTLRGYEGTAAGLYFEAYGSFFPQDAPFERRSRRPPHNAANAILSYCYTLLGAEAESFCHLEGLDPSIGFFHEPAERRASLALDIIEPFRAPVADAMALDLLSHGTLHPRNHFEERDGGVFLNGEGKRRFFVAYERRMEREFLSEQHHFRTSLRNELERMVKGVRDAFLNGTMPQPFVMN